MIEIKSLNKSYKENILNNISYKFPEKGFVSIVGPSGCGKSTLLNIISGIDQNYSGEVMIENTNLKFLKDKDQSTFRLRNIGYVFQDFKLFNLLTVESNVMFTLEAISNASKIIKKKMCSDILKLCGMEHKKKQVVNKLSGGEKQRVAIARALITSPRILLCDEPTGNLDEKNAEKIFDLLKIISKNYLVIVVTHDNKSAYTYSDRILSLKDKSLIEQINPKTKNVPNNYLKMENRFSRKDPKLSFDFQFKNSFSKMKAKKFRTGIITSISFLSLLGIGLSMIFSSTITNAVKESFSKIIEKNQIVVERKSNNPNSFNAFYSATYQDVNEIKNKYSKQIDDIGVTYLNNFENFFKDEDYVYTASTTFKHQIDSLNVRSINDFNWITDVDIKNIYPSRPKNLLNEEVILGLSFKDMSNLCFNLQIERSFKSLGNYIKQNNFIIGIGAKNEDWGYENDEFLKVMAVVETKNSVFIHQNTLWNQYMFEERMRLPSSDNIETTNLAPFTLKKIYNIHFLDEPSDFLDASLFDEDLQKFLFERMSESYSSSYEKNKEIMDKTLLVFILDKNCIDLSKIELINKVAQNVNGFMIISEGGYQAYSSSLVLGFSNNIFFSTSLAKLDDAVDAFTSINKDDNLSLNLPEGIAEGNILKAEKSVMLSTRLPLDENGEKISLEKDEVIISSGLLKSIKLIDNKKEENLYYAANKQNGGSDYCYGKFKIKKVVENEKKIIYQKPQFCISFFRDQLHISSFNLLPISLIINLENDDDIEQKIQKLNNTFKDYKFSNPLIEIGKSIENTMEYVVKTILIFSIISISISIFLLLIVTYLNIIESKNDINLLKHLGFQNSKIISMFITSSFVQGLISTFLSSVGLIFIEFFLTFILSNTLSIPLNFTIEIKPILICLFLGLTIPIFFSFIISFFAIRNKKSKKLNL